MADAFWIETLACPCCRAPLGNAHQCQRCGTEFPAEDGVPRLMTQAATCEVRFDYSPAGSETEAILDRALGEPPLFPGDGLPYHLDRAHAQRIAALPAGGRVLEIGCGGGQNRQWVEGRGQQYVGTDVSKTRVFEWLQRYGGPDLLCDAHFLPFRESQFDLVYSAATTEHLACPQRVVQEVFRVLKPGGYFLSNVSFLEPWHDNSYFHMTPLGVIELLTRAGFEIEFLWPGRGYSGFVALPSMAFKGPLKLMRLLGRVAQGLYGVQNAMRNLVSRLRGQPADSTIRRRAIVAGAIDWIARRPGVQV
jgi:SAM-dependent methyltransferase